MVDGTTTTRKITMTNILEAHRSKWMGGGPSNSFFPMSQYTGKAGGTFQSGITDKKLINMFLRDELAYRIVRDFAVDPLKRGHEVRAIENDNGKLKTDYAKISSKVDLNKRLGAARVLSRLAGRSLLLLGTEDSEPADRPPQNVRGLNFVRPVANWHIRGVRQDTNPSSSTFGQIIAYDIVSKLDSAASGIITVDASRVIVLTNDEFDNDPRGVSALFPLFDIMNIKKETDHALGEAAVRNAEPWRVLTLPPDADADEAMAVEEELYAAKGRNTFIQPGTGSDQTDYKWKQLPPNQINPKDWIDWINTRAAGGSGMPKTIIEGATPGSVEGSWVSIGDYWKKCGEMQIADISPIIGEIVRRLQGWGLLDEKEFEVWWPTLWELDDKELAQIANLQANAFNKAVSGAKMLFELPGAVKALTWGIDDNGFYLKHENEQKDADGRYYPIANMTKTGTKVQTGGVRQRAITAARDRGASRKLWNAWKLAYADIEASTNLELRQLVNEATKDLYSQTANILQEIMPGYDRKRKPATRQEMVRNLSKDNSLGDGIEAIMKTVNKKLKFNNSGQLSKILAEAMLAAHGEGWGQTDEIYNSQASESPEYVFGQARDNKFRKKADTFGKNWETEILEVAANIITLALKDGDPMAGMRQNLTTALARVFNPDSQTQTAVHYAAETGRLDMFRACGETEVSWLTSPGERIREEHAARDGNSYTLAAADILLGDTGCNCTTIPKEK